MPYSEILTWVAVAGGATLVVLVGAFAWRRSSREQLYRELAAKRVEIIADKTVRLADTIDRAALAAEFKEKLLVHAENILAPETLAAALEEAEENKGRVERSYVPTHKQGGTVSYEKVHYHAPTCLAIFHSKELIDFVSAVVGEKVVPTADHDQSSCSLLCYTQAGDHINWHFDHNFYPGRHFTVLISLRNTSAAGGVSSSDLMYKSADGEEHVVPTLPNDIVVFEGQHTLHKATQAAEGDVRLILSMTYCTNPNIGWFGETIRRIKDTAFYGVRTLWD